MRIKLLLLSSLLGLLLCGVVPCHAQNRGEAQDRGEEILRVRTRVVFVDTLVQDRRTGAPVADLTRENFEVIADGRPRPLAYFSREGEVRRRPLALVLLLDVSRIGAGRFLRRPEVIESVLAALSRLAPEDEVAVMTSSTGGFGGTPEVLLNLTRDRVRVATALSVAPVLVASGVGSSPQSPGSGRDINAPAEMFFNEEMEHLVREVVRLATDERPNSQITVVHITDGLQPMPFTQRDEMVTKLVRANANFNALISNSRLGFRLLAMVGNSALNAVSAVASVSNHAQLLSRETGGQMVRVRRPQDYGAGLERIIGGLAARYSLGFSLEEQERDDGRVRPLEVRVRARNERGRERTLTVIARRSYSVERPNNIEAHAR
jgi:VWFA-related protein